MFIGRTEELHFLNRCYEKPSGQLMVLYGRRRIGKTELLREFCLDKPHVFYSCYECTDREQLTAFSSRIIKGNPLEQYISVFESWESAFRSFSTDQPTRKKLLIIDEFPYMVNGNSAIPSILQNLWDEIMKDKNIMVILCGSSVSFMEKEVLGEKNPLFGRATGVLKLDELTVMDCFKFFPEYSNEDRLLAYAVLGGVPHYLKQFENSLSLDNNIMQNILMRGSVLYNEVEFLMKQELRETQIYNTIIRAIALGNTKLNDIYQKTQIDKAKISVYIKTLIELGVVEKELPVAGGIKEAANVQRGLYNIKDNYFRFWYRFVFPSLPELETGDTEGVYHTTIKPHLYDFTSKAFEKSCISYLRVLNRQGMLPFRFTQIGRWWHKDVEIDIVTIGPKGEIIFGECKWQKRQMGIGDLLILKEKAIRFNSERSFYYLFSKGGFTDELRTIAMASKDVRLFEPEDVFI